MFTFYSIFNTRSNRSNDEENIQNKSFRYHKEIGQTDTWIDLIYVSVRKIGCHIFNWT